MRAVSLVAAALVVLLATAHAENPERVPSPDAVPHAVDGLFDDWATSEPLSSDSGDGLAVDVRQLRVRSDAERVTFLIELEPEAGLQSNNSLTLLIDGDGDASTGHTAEGIGAELEWVFGQRSGRIFLDGRERGVEQADVGLRQAPSVTSERFEVSFLRETSEGLPLLPGPTVSVVLLEGIPGGDRFPDHGALAVELRSDPPPKPLPVSLERRSPDDVRVLTWNVLFDGLFKRPAPFLRVLKALDPDIICFQEIWSHTSRQAADQVSLALPTTDWHAASVSEGHVVSRYRFAQEVAIDEAGNYWVLVDLPDDRYAADMSVVSAHPPCCEQETERQRELDGIAAWHRELVTPGGAELPFGTPLVIAGDMNLVGGARQLRTLLDGAIVDEAAFGPSHHPDWDGTPLADAWPRIAGGVDAYTWRDERSSFAPGKLDYIVYSDSVLKLRNAFVLDTQALDSETLSRYGLHAHDTLAASDHLPVVADFTPAVSPARTGSDE